MIDKVAERIIMAIDIGKRIEEYRGKRGMSRAELATGVDISRDAIWKYESGKQVPSVPSLCRLAKVLGVSMERDLLGINDWSHIQQTGEGDIVQIISFPDKICEDQKRIAEWEEKCHAKKLIQTFFSRIYNTDRVALSLFEKRHIHQPELSEDQKQKVLDGRNLRRDLLYQSVRYDSREIVNEHELRRFTLGEPPDYNELTAEDRIEQYRYVLEEVLAKYGNVSFGLTRELVPIECLIIDNDAFVIQNIRGYIVISSKEKTTRYIKYFDDVWLNATRGVGVERFIERQIRKIEEER